MAESMTSKSFREIVVPTNPTVRWKEIVVNTGASVSSLQDIKVPDSCGGYSYLDSGIAESLIRNRFIYWRTSNDVLELIEQSLDLNLMGSQVRFRFHDSQILGGITVKESHGSIFILVATVASVHRLIFPHPSRLQRNNVGYTNEDPVPSIFYDASLMTVTDTNNMHMLNPGGSITSHLHSAATYLSSECEAFFAFSSNDGNILLIKMPPPEVQGVVQQFDLRQSSMMQKLLGGLMRSGQEATDASTSLVIHLFHGEAYIFAVCRDYKLRIWSTKTKECIQAFNLLECCPDHVHGHGEAGNGHTIKRVHSNGGELKLCVCLNFADKNQFCFVQPHLVNGRMDIYHNTTVLGIHEDLVDYCATDEYLWTLWTNHMGESVARVRCMTGYIEDNDWEEVILQPMESSDIMVPPHSDPREIYMSRIFHPRRFSLQDIQKALNVYRRSLDMTSVADAGAVDVATLKEEVVLAVEDAIRVAAVANELAEEEYYQIQLDQWKKFHSCCAQYQEVGAKMKGLFTDPVTGLICFIKKGGLSYVRPCDRIEDLYLGSGQWSQHLDQDELDHQLRFDVVTLGRCLSVIRSKITEETAAQLEYRLLLNDDIRELANQIVHNLIFDSGLSEESIVADAIRGLLQTIVDLPGAVKVILQAVDLSQPQDEDFQMDDSDINVHGRCRQLFTSSTAVEIISTSLYQISATRLSALRDLLLLQRVAYILGEKDGVTPAVMAEIEDDLVPQTVMMIQSYVLLQWVSECLATPTTTSSLEFNTRQLATLELGENLAMLTQQKPGQENSGLTELFIDGIGGEQARMILEQARLMEEEPCCTWTIGVLEITKSISRLIWPLNNNFLFPEFLMGSCQYLHLQEYARLLSSWCEGHAARKFLLGLGYLHFDEPQKAAQCFREAKEGVSTESFFRHKLLQTDEAMPRKLDVLYYLKVLKQIEEFGAPDVVLSLAETAINDADCDDPNLPTLWSKVFKYQLELGHNEEAYTAMISNPDPSRKKDCLRQLLVTLCERGDLYSLVKFSYTDLEEEVVAILENRARAVEMMTHNYYDLLYAFHIYRNNFRKAGRVMYEHGMRLGREVVGRRGLEKQAQCYLATINVLHLVKPEYAWIVKPVQSGNNKILIDTEMSQEDGSKQTAPKMEILEVADIEKEYLLVDARLRLIQKDVDTALSTGPMPRPDEMVGLLVKAGMYDRAIIICQAFNMKFVTVFESLALRCVNLARSSSWDNSVITITWDWLQENNLAMSHIMKDSSATDMAWMLLQHYLDVYEDSTGQYHRCTAIKLLSHGFPLPTWLVNSYKGLNVAELLKLYIDFDMLEDAVLLTVEYVDAVMNSFEGHGSEQFRLKVYIVAMRHFASFTEGCLHHHAQSCWLPYTCIDQLISSLQGHRHDLLYQELFESLEEKLVKYNAKVWQFSAQVCDT